MPCTTPPAPPPAQSNAALIAEQLQFCFEGQPPLLAGWTARLAPGVTWLQGDTGSGKTTLLRLMAGELAPQRGQLRLGALAWPGDGAAYRQQLLHTDAPWLHDPQLSAAAIATRLAGTYPAFDSAAWAAHLDGFGLGPHLAKPMLALSSGSRHKLRLAAALSAGAALTLADEPSAGLDAPALRHLIQALGQVHAAADRVWVVAGYLGPVGLADATVLGLPVGG